MASMWKDRQISRWLQNWAQIFQQGLFSLLHLCPARKFSIAYLFFHPTAALQQDRERMEMVEKTWQVADKKLNHTALEALPFSPNESSEDICEGPATGPHNCSNTMPYLLGPCQELQNCQHVLHYRQSRAWQGPWKGLSRQTLHCLQSLVASGRLGMASWDSAAARDSDHGQCSPNGCRSKSWASYLGHCGHPRQWLLASSHPAV